MWFFCYIVYFYIILNFFGFEEVLVFRVWIDVYFGMVVKFGVDKKVCYMFFERFDFWNSIFKIFFIYGIISLIGRI